MTPSGLRLLAASVALAGMEVGAGAWAL